ncbi:unnamed protein product [Eruca vesicaria subsp. sativa]|uniref:Uncharacterized protein n=1 Tax=Eruca vesicaria subsp. sativa TaxID=29727 RepID=A0ABC8K5Y6_ERUVS|nr:unnamed protein product [Eruca vesicaria subsp. sativa]
MERPGQHPFWAKRVVSFILCSRGLLFSQTHPVMYQLAHDETPRYLLGLAEVVFPSPELNGDFGCATDLSSSSLPYHGVGSENLIGEIIRLKEILPPSKVCISHIRWICRSEILLTDVLQLPVYEETAGLTVNDHVLRTHKPLSVELGLGILGNIFDVIQVRPLKNITKRSGDVYILVVCMFQLLSLMILSR